MEDMRQAKLTRRQGMTGTASMLTGSWYLSWAQPAGSVQALCAQLNARAIQAIVVAISSVPVGRGGVIDEEWAVTNAIRVWGPRSVKQAATVGPVGGQREARGSEASLFPVQLIGAVFISAQPTRSEGSRGLRRLQRKAGAC